ncbi:oligosaccharide flippase family protein [Candidatus Parvarchaeota archaeon]|nr:oligosaccharide flippase family protein [Candidatus Parvarchaeota archaeon]
MPTIGTEDSDLEQEKVLVASNSIYGFMRSISKFVMSFVVSIFLVRFLGPVNYGVYSVVIIYWGIFSVISSYGIDGVLVYAIAKYRASNQLDRINSILKKYAIALLISSSVVSLVMFALAGVISGLYHQPVMANLLRILAIGLVLYTFIDRFFYPVYTGYQKMKYGFVVGILFDSLRIVQLVIVYLGFGLLGLITFYDVIYLSVVSVSVFFVYKIVKKNRRKLPVRPSDVPVLNSYRKFSYGTSLISSLYGPFITIFLGAVAPNLQFVSFYRVGILMAGIIGMPAAAIGSAFFPTITKYFHRKDMKRFYRLQKILLRYSALITLPLVIGSIVAVGPLVSFLYRSAFSGAELPFVIMLVAVLITGIFGPVSVVLSAIGRQKFFMYSTIGGAIVGVLMTLFLVPALLSVGAAVVYLGVSLSMLSINLFFSLKYIHIDMPVMAILKGAAAAGVMGVLIHFLLIMVKRLFFLPFILIFSLAVYLVLIYMMGAINRQDIAFLSRLLRVSRLLRKLGLQR